EWARKFEVTSLIGDGPTPTSTLLKTLSWICAPHTRPIIPIAGENVPVAADGPASTAEPVNRQRLIVTNELLEITTAGIAGWLAPTAGPRKEISSTVIFMAESIMYIGFWEEKPTPANRLGKPWPLISIAARPLTVIVPV